MKKEYRIKRNEEFSAIIKQRKQVVSSSFIIYYSPKKEDHARIGISVSKKIGNAVMRNKIKRQIRMMCLKLIDFEKYENDLIIIVKKSYLNNNFEDNINDLENNIKKYII